VSVTFSEEVPPVVETQEALDQMVVEAGTDAVVGLDTEFLREKTYRAKLCLVQVATKHGIYLVDPLSGQDLSGLASLISDPDVEVLVHAGRQDFEIFFERYGAVPKNIFDVQLAAAFAGYGASLPYGRLVETITKTTLTKGESYTDWCRRPLTESQLKYAADDVRYLHVVAATIKDNLFASGRAEWARAEMEFFSDGSLYTTEPADAWRRVSGRGALSGKQMGILRALAAWRETAAQKRDIPRGWVIKDQSLIEIARKAPTNVGALKSLRGFAPKEAERSGTDILAAIERGKDAPHFDAPPTPSRAAQARARTLSGLADAIVRSRCEAAGIATELVATRGELEAVLSDIFSSGELSKEHRLLEGWRRDLAGDAVVALAEGRIAVRSVDKHPYIEEVVLDE
jgi:ribonuclease D